VGAAAGVFVAAAFHYHRDTMQSSPSQPMFDAPTPFGRTLLLALRLLP